MNVLREASSVLTSETSTFETAMSWMRDASNVNRVTGALGATPALSRVFLSLLFMHHEREDLFQENDLDNIMRRLCAGMCARVAREGAAVEDILSATERAEIMLSAWKRRDRDQIMEHLRHRCVSIPDENDDERVELLRMYEGLGGDAAQVAEQHQRRWARVRADDLPSFVAETVERAFWDVLHERVASGDVEGTLFSLLRDLRQGVLALLAASPRTASSFEEHFDLEWLLERHRNGSISPLDISRYRSYVSDLLCRMSAPADEAEVRVWAEEQSDPNRTVASLVFFVREASGHMRRIVERLEALRDARAVQHR